MLIWVTASGSDSRAAPSSENKPACKFGSLFTLTNFPLITPASATNSVAQTTEPASQDQPSARDSALLGLPDGEIPSARRWSFSQQTFGVTPLARTVWQSRSNGNWKLKRRRKET
ncbi:hypothetical protein SRHO_G00163360 [Serrasalmus rhombeus]